MSEILLCPSLMCANFDNLKKEVIELDNAGTDVFHIDIMDGLFVPNFGMGLQDFETVRKSTDKLVDVHLMIESPGNYIDLFADMGADIIYIHPEADNHSAKTLGQIKNKDKMSGIAINPGTSISTIEALLPLVDYIMVMTVNPGFAGQKYLDFVDFKIKQLVEIQKNYNFEIMVDGAISEEKINQLYNMGVKGFVLGTSSLFNKEDSYTQLLSRFKEIAK